MKTFAALTFALVTTTALALTGCGSSVGGGGEGGEGPDSCDDYAAGIPAAPRGVAVRFVNNTDRDIYVGDPQESCGGYLPFTLARGGTAVKPQIGLCEFTCAQVMSSGCPACPAACALTPTLRIASGGFYETYWEGVEYIPTELPAECLSEESCGGSCNLPRAGSGVYDATGTAYTAITECSDPADCTCELAGPAGNCALPGNAKPTGQPIVASVSFDYGSGVGDLEFVFD